VTIAGVIAAIDTVAIGAYATTRRCRHPPTGHTEHGTGYLVLNLVFDYKVNRLISSVSVVSGCAF
jgi:hypothetical protein